MNNDFLLEDRLQKIRQIISKYGEGNFYISFSGGKDSCVVSALVDLAIPDNRIPRVFANTGIEYNMIVEFVHDLQKHDARIIEIKPKTPIIPMLKRDGYPFKNKQHSQFVEIYQRNKFKRPGILAYLGEAPMSTGRMKAPQGTCPKILRYQFTPEFNLKISDKCCKRLKVEPLHEWQKQNKRPFGILGLMREEGGRRFESKCLVFKANNLYNFQPLVAISKEWEEWFINKYNISICALYYPPYNLQRTGCKGCPFAPNIEQQLRMIEQFFPEERKQCEIIWKPVYDEYRRLNYRLKGSESSE